MSFRDFPSRGNPPQGLEFEGESSSPNKGVNSQQNSNRRQQQSQLKKNSLRRASSNNTRPTNRTAAHQLDSLQCNRSKSDSTAYQNYHQQSYTNANDNTFNNNTSQQSVLLVQQREEEYAMQVMQQREDELLDIHRKMNVVNEIYKDLGEVVDSQQEQIDQVEDQFEGAAEDTRRGLEHIEKANKRHGRRKANESEGEKGGSDKRKQFFLFALMAKSASEVAKLVSVCGGSASADYVDSDSWKK